MIYIYECLKNDLIYLVRNESGNDNINGDGDDNDKSVNLKKVKNVDKENYDKNSDNA